MTSAPITSEFISQSIYRFEENTPRIEKCLRVLSEDEVWLRRNSSSNSIGNLVLHLCGNITQYIISCLGERPDVRLRDLEFSTTGEYSKDELLKKLQSTSKEAANIIKDISEPGLMKMRSVQGFEFTGIGIILHVVEHYSYHTGQIAMLTKLIKNTDLGFYGGIDLNIKNKRK